MLVPNINQHLTALTVFLNKYEPGLYANPICTPCYRLTLQNSFIREKAPAISLNYGDILIVNKYHASYVIASPKVGDKAIKLEIFTWETFNKCGKIETLIVAPDTQFIRHKVYKVSTEFDVMARAVKLFANPQDNTLTADDLKQVIWHIKNSKHPILRLLNMPIDDFGTMMANFLWDSIEKRFDFE